MCGRREPFQPLADIASVLIIISIVSHEQLVCWKTMSRPKTSDIGQCDVQLSASYVALAKFEHKI